MKKKNIKIYLLSLLALAQLFSCADFGIDLPAKKQAQNVLLLSYSIDESAPVSYAVAELAREKAVLDIYTLFFDPSNSDNYVGYTRSGISASTSTGTAELSLPAGVDISNAWELLFIANLESCADKRTHSDVHSWLQTELTGKTLLQAQSILMAIAPDASGLKAPLPMSGQQSKPAGTNQVSVNLRRRVARIDVKNSAPNFELVTAQLWNARSKTDFFSPAPVPAPAGSDNYYNGNEVAASNNKIEGKLYAFPNKLNAPDRRDKQTTCIIIGGKFGGSSTTTYYRYNVAAAGSTHELKANSAYTVNITEVKVAGAATPAEAADNPGPEMSYSLSFDNQAEIDALTGISDEGGSFPLTLTVKETVKVNGVVIGPHDVALAEITEDMLTLASSDEDVASLSLSGGQIIVSVSANTTDASRSAALTITPTGGNAAILHLIQFPEEDPDLDLSSHPYSPQTKDGNLNENHPFVRLARFNVKDGGSGFADKHDSGKDPDGDNVNGYFDFHAAPDAVPSGYVLPTKVELNTFVPDKDNNPPKSIGEAQYRTIAGVHFRYRWKEFKGQPGSYVEIRAFRGGTDVEAKQKLIMNGQDVAVRFFPCAGLKNWHGEELLEVNVGWYQTKDQYPEVGTCYQWVLGGAEMVVEVVIGDKLDALLVRPIKILTNM